MKTILPLLSLLLAGCVVPGQISTMKSTFDGSTAVHSEPAWVYDGMLSSEIMLSLFRSSNMPSNEVVLTASASKNIADGPSLKFNINGEIVALTSFDATSDISTPPGMGVRCAKRYNTDLAFISRLIDATNVTVRLDLFRSYAEGRFSNDGPTMSRPAFRRFLAALDPSRATNASPVVTKGTHR